jgi:hypothetical protein
LGALGLFLQRADDPDATRYPPEFWKEVIKRAKEACDGDSTLLRHLKTIESGVDQIYGSRNATKRARMLKAVTAMTRRLENPTPRQRRRAGTQS